MIVELLGMPGSGKSTWARALEAEGKWVRVRIQSRLELCLYAGLFLIRHPVSAWKQWCYLFRFRGDSSLWYTKFMNLYVMHHAKYMKASMMSHAVLDQGHLQNLLSLFDGDVSLEVVREYLAILPRPDLVLLFDTSSHVCRERVALRTHRPRHSLMNDASYDAWMTANEARFLALRELLPVTHQSEVVVMGCEEASRALVRNFRPIRFVMHVRMPTEKAHGLQIAKTLEALHEAGEHVELWIPVRQNPLTQNLFEYYHLRGRFPVRTLWSGEVLRTASTFGAVAYWMDGLFFALRVCVERLDAGAVYYTRSPLLAWVLSWRGCHVYFEAHSWPESKVRVFRAMLARVTRIIANSEGTKKVFVEHGFPSVVVVENGVDVEHFASSLTPASARHTLGIRDDERIILYAGSFARWKGVATLYVAWSRVASQFPLTTLYFVGGTMAELASHRECRGIFQDTRTRIVPHQSVSQIPFYLRSADVLCIPNEAVSEESVRYTAPIKLYEYIASRRHILASDLPSIHAIAKDAVTYVPAGDVDAWGKAIGEALAVAPHDTLLPAIPIPTWSDRARKLSRICALPPDTTAVAESVL